MAYLAFDDLSDDVKQKLGAGQTGGAAIFRAPAEGQMQPAQTPATPAAPTTPGGAGAGGGKFVNFERLLNANRDVADRTAGEMAARVDKDGQAATDATTFTLNTFKGDADRNTHTYDAGYGDLPFNGITYGSATNPDIEVAPGAYIPRAKAEALSNVRYQGPSSLLDAQYGYGSLMSRAQGAQDDAQAVKDRGAGLQTLMRKQYGPSTDGGSRMSAALTGYAGAPQFDALAEKYSGLTKLVSDSLGESQAYGEHAANVTQNTADRYGDQVAKFDADQANAADEATRQTQEDFQKFPHNDVYGIDQDTFGRMTPEERQTLANWAGALDKANPIYGRGQVLQKMTELAKQIKQRYGGA